MSRVYETLQHDNEYRHEVIPAIPIERSCRQPVVLSPLGLLKMEREMVQLQQRLTSLLSDPEHSILQFISCRNAEGVSTIVREFGRVLVEKLGKKVLLVDGDSEKMTQHHFLGVPAKMSLQRIMQHGGDLDQAVTSVVHPRLFLAQLSGDRQEDTQYDGASSHVDLWVHIRKQFDMIVIDSAPIDVSDEGLDWCAVADGVVMVVEAEKTSSHVISNLQERILHNDGKFLGVVFNKQHHYIPEWLYKRL